MMKKIYTLALTALFAHQLSAQIHTETFENFTLTEEGFLIGVQPVDTLYGEHMKFVNDYTPAWQSWMGIAISNIQNNTQGDFGNQYASITNGGDQSNNYAVVYNNGVITFNESSIVKSMRITNTTYAALTMRDGDPFCKQFGSPLNAAGIEDGTNGADFFKINFKFYRADNSMIDITKDFYLADFRFEAEEEDYILMDWQTLQFDELATEPVKYIEMTMESSDQSDWGMNNPAYFAMDNIVIEQTDLNVSNVINSITLFPNPTRSTTQLNGAFESWHLIDMTGKSIATGSTSNIDLSTLPTGIYAIEIFSTTGKQIQRIQKL